MDESVVGAAASRAPGITDMPEAAVEQATRVYAGMGQIQRAFEEVQPDGIIKILNEHLVYFYWVF